MLAFGTKWDGLNESHRSEGLICEASSVDPQLRLVLYTVLDFPRFCLALRIHSFSQCSGISFWLPWKPKHQCSLQPGQEWPSVSLQVISLWIGNVQVWYCLCSRRVTNPPHPQALECPLLSAFRRPLLPTAWGTWEPPWGGEAWVNDTRPPGCGGWVALPRLYSWLPVCWKIRMPPAVPWLPGRAVPVGFRESTIYLFSEASLFLRFWRVQLRSGCGYVSAASWAICLPPGPSWFTGEATDRVWSCHSLDCAEIWTSRILCVLFIFFHGQAFHAFFPPFLLPRVFVYHKVI